MKKLLCLTFSFAGLLAIAGSGLSSGGGSVNGGSGGGGSSVVTTNFSGIYVTNTAYASNVVVTSSISASNFVATAVGYTNIFDNTLFTNGLVVASSSYIPTNQAPFNTVSVTTGSFAQNTLYTNDSVGAQRALLIGSVYFSVSSLSDQSITCFYTNNGIGYSLPIQKAHAVSAGIALLPFCVPLCPSATFVFRTNSANTAVTYLTNAILWKL